MPQKFDRSEKPSKPVSTPSNLTPIPSPTEEDAFKAFFTLLIASEVREDRRNLAVLTDSHMHRLRRRDAERAEYEMWIVVDYLESLPRAQMNQTIRRFVRMHYPGHRPQDVLKSWRARLMMFGVEIEARLGGEDGREPEKPVLPLDWGPREAKEGEILE